MADDDGASLREALERAVTLGTPVDLGAPPRTTGGDRSRPTVPADLLVDVLCTPLPSGASHRALKITAARIKGSLNCEYRALLGPLVLKCCQLDDVNLEQATAVDIWLWDCEVGELQASQLRTDFNLVVRGSTFRGEFWMDGAHIGGQLDASGSAFLNPGALALTATSSTVERDVYLSEGFRAVGMVDLRGAEFKASCYFNSASFAHPAADPALDVSGMTVTGGLDLSDSNVVGTVGMSGATIGGDLNLARAGIFSTGVALYADHVEVKGQVTAPDLRVNGDVYLRRARVDALDLTGAHLFGGELGNALNGEQLVVHRDMKCGNGFTTRGETNLRGGQVGGNLDLTGAAMIRPEGRTFQADGLTVSRSLLAEGVTCVGEVFLRGATIGRTLDLDAALLVDREWSALDVSGATIGQDFRCAVTTLGHVKVRGARVTGDLTLDDSADAAPELPPATELAVIQGRFDADGLTVDGDVRAVDTVVVDGPVDLRSAVIGHALVWGPVLADKVVVDLRSAKVHRLDDNRRRWPERLHLDGFTYEVFRGSSRSDGVGDRLQWITWSERYEGYKPRVFNQLAEAYRRAGNDDAVREILLAKQRARSKAQRDRHPARPSRTLLRLWDQVLTHTIGYGQYPGRILRWLAVALLVTWPVFSILHPAQVHPAKGDSAAQQDFVAFLYSLDLLLPVATLGQRTAFVTEGVAAWVAAALTVVGWLLGAVLVAGLSGVFRRD